MKYSRTRMPSTFSTTNVAGCWPMGTIHDGEKDWRQFLRLGGLFYASLFLVLVSGGCTSKHDHMHGHEMTKSSETMVVTPSGKRMSLGLDQTAREAHQAVMRDHLKAIHEIVAALAVEEFERAQDLTETRLGFAKHREAMRQLNPEDFPPAYHDLAMVHHQTAEELAKVIPSKNLKRILPHVERTLNACVECHEQYKR